MNGAHIAAKVAYGYAKAASVVGLPHDLYRPSVATLPALDPRNLLRTISFIASATATADFSRPSKHGQPYRYALMDTRAPLGAMASDAVQAGDYVTGPTGTHLMLSAAPDEIAMVAECNAVLTAYRPVQHSQATEAVYGGRSAATDTLVMQSFPAAVTIAERTQATRADLPGDVPVKGAMIYLPALAGVLLRVMDHLVDDLGRRFTVGSCEVSPLGWRLTTTLSEA